MKINLENKKYLERYYIYHIKLNIPLCDGLTNNLDLISNILLPLFIISGIGFFIWLLTNYKYFKEKFFNYEKK